MTGESIIALLGQYTGALIITFLLTRGANWLLKKTADKKKVAFLSFAIISLICLLLGSTSLNFGKAFALYIPCTVLWLIIDLNKARKPVKEYMGETSNIESE
jgi:hypothetical protein